MSMFRSYLVYSWAALALPIILVTFMGMQPLAHGLVTATGLHVHPIYSGAEVVRTIEHGSYRTLIHRPVFDGLIGQRDRGFIQVEWQATDANLPPSIDERIDLEGDGSNDFDIQLNTTTQQADVQPFDARVLSVDEVIAVPHGCIVRVNLQKKPVH